MQSILPDEYGENKQSGDVLFNSSHTNDMRSVRVQCVRMSAYLHKHTKSP